MGETRTILYPVRMNADESSRAKRIAEHLGVPVSSLLRMLLLEKERALGIVPGAKGAAKRGRT